MMFGKRFDKKGELTTTQIVGLIILLLSFSVILILIFRLDLGKLSDREICHNSVVLKGQSTLKTGPLDCRTKYLCISDGGECENINLGSEYELKSSDEEQKKNEIMNVIAKEMASCWWQFGEGEVRYTGTAASASVDCSICSTIDFDGNINLEISYEEFYDYLALAEKDGTESYLEYLYGIEIASDFEPQEQIEGALNNTNIDLAQKYSLITGIDNSLIDVDLGKIPGSGGKILKYISEGDDEWLRVHLVPTNEISQTKCSNFLTKA